jgi:uncharacterized coiled-coil protein SlyX
MADIPEGAPVMTGIFTVLNYPAIILFDSGASHSFISAKFSAKCQLPFHHTDGGITISTPGGRVATYQINRQVPIKLGSLVIRTTLLILGLDSVDIILGTDWLTRHQAVLNIAARAIEIHSAAYGETTLYLPDQGCTRSCAFTMIESPVERIPVVRDYPDVFLDELPGMPPDRDIEFAIELQPGTAPISKRPYRMPIYPGQTAHLTVRCMNALYRLQVMRGEAMSHLMALLEATKITLDNREELVVDLSTEMVEKDLQVEQLSNEIQELEELVGTRENTIEVLEDQLINTQQQLAEANEHLDMHHQEIQDMEANEDVDIEGGEEPASSLDTAGSGRPPSPESSVASFAH